MLMAVSCLSPVITQTRIPAASRVAMAAGTPSCAQAAKVRTRAWASGQALGSRVQMLRFWGDCLRLLYPG